MAVSKDCIARVPGNTSTVVDRYLHSMKILSLVHVLQH